MIPAFSIARLPRIEFGAGAIGRLPALLSSYGRRVLLVTGARSFIRSPYWPRLLQDLEQAGLTWQHQTVDGEPSPAVVDQAVARFRDADVQVVAGIGGGSVLDAAKAIAGLLPSGESVMEFLEGVGPQRPYPGPALPYVAVPTTAGTGSEATKNAVLSLQGEKGFKKSFRHEWLVPEYALVDPELLSTCPPAQIAANAMDALTQLLESYVSLRANPLTDALAEAGLRAIHEGLFSCYEGGDGAADGRARLAFAALLSGICLAQTGLGAVHGLASPLGAFFPIPHGMVCGTLVAATTRVNLEALKAREPAHPARKRYARLGNLLGGRHHDDEHRARESLLSTLAGWTERLAMPRLREFGVQQADFRRIVAEARGSSMKTNPIVLSDQELTAILAERL